MPKAQLIFTTIIQDSQDFGSNNEHMVSRVFFDLHVGSDLHTGLFTDIKQTVGADYERDPLEVTLPQYLADSVSFTEFRKLVEQYYREALGSTGSAVRFGPGAKVRMMHNIINRRPVADIEFFDGRGPAGW